MTQTDRKIYHVHELEKNVLKFVWTQKTMNSQSNIEKEKQNETNQAP